MKIIWMNELIFDAMLYQYTWKDVSLTKKPRINNVIFMLIALTESLASVLKCLTNIAVVRSLYSKIMQMNGNNKQSKTR